MFAVSQRGDVENEQHLGLDNHSVVAKLARDHVRMDRFVDGEEVGPKETC